MSRWYLGSMNDGLFIIDTPPRPSTEDQWFDRPDGPTLVLNVTAIGRLLAEAIISAHNADVDVERSIEALGPLTDRHVIVLHGWNHDDFHDLISVLLTLRHRNLVINLRDGATITTLDEADMAAAGWQRIPKEES